MIVCSSVSQPLDRNPKVGRVNLLVGANQTLILYLSMASRFLEISTWVVSYLRLN